MALLRELLEMTSLPRLHEVHSQRRRSPHNNFGDM